MKKNTILFLSAIFISAIILPIKSVSAYNDTIINIDYQNEIFQNVVPQINESIEEVKNVCSSYYDEYTVSLWRYNDDYRYRCSDISEIGQDVHFFIRNGYTSGLTNTERGSVNTLFFGPNFSAEVSVTTPAGLAANFNITASSVYGTSVNYIGDGHWSNTNVILYSSVPVYYHNYNDYSAHLKINDREVEADQEIPFLYNEEKYLLIENSCDNTPGYCSIKINVNLHNLNDSKEDYRLHYYTEDGEIDKKLLFIIPNEYSYEVSESIYTDTTLFVELYKVNADGEKINTLQSEKIAVDVLYDDPTIKMLTYHGAGLTTINIYYFANKNKGYVYLYRVDNGEWQEADQEIATTIEINNTENCLVEAEIIEKGTGKVITYNSINVGLGDLPIIQFYELSTEDGGIDLQVGIRNVKSDGYTYSYKVDNKSWDEDHTIQKTDDLQILYSNVFDKNASFSIKVFDENKNVIITEYHAITLEKYELVTKNYMTYITDFFDRYSNIIAEFKDIIQFAYNNLESYMQLCLIAIYTTILIVVTVKLAR